MRRVTLDLEKSIATVRLSGVSGNAIDAALASELRETFSDLAERRDAHAVLITSARDGVFSGGFNVFDLLGRPRGEMETFLRSFYAAVEALWRLPQPSIAAINGHAIGGGCILTLAADYRYMGAGFRIGMNETDLGLPLPFEAVQLLTRFLSPAAARHVALEGNVYSADEARGLGLVDRVLSPADVVPASRELAARFAEKPAAAVQETKRGILQTQGALVIPSRRAIEAFLDAWYAPDTQARLEAVRARLGSRADSG